MYGAVASFGCLLSTGRGREPQVATERGSRLQRGRDGQRPVERLVVAGARFVWPCRNCQRQPPRRAFLLNRHVARRRKHEFFARDWGVVARNPTQQHLALTRVFRLPAVRESKPEKDVVAILQPGEKVVVNLLLDGLRLPAAGTQLGEGLG